MMNYLFSKKKGEYYFTGIKSSKESCDELKKLIKALKKPSLFDKLSDEDKMVKTQVFLNRLMDYVPYSEKNYNKLLNDLHRINDTINYVCLNYNASDNFHDLIEDINELDLNYQAFKEINRLDTINRLSEVFGGDELRSLDELINDENEFLENDLIKEVNDYVFVAHVSNCLSNLKVSYNHLLKKLRISAVSTKCYKLNELTRAYRLKEYTVLNGVITCRFTTNPNN